MSRIVRRYRYWMTAISLTMVLTGCSRGSPTDADAAKKKPVPPISTAPAPTPAPTASDTLLRVTWQPNGDAVAGYIVYYGTSAATATAVAGDIALTTTGFNAQSPSANYYAKRDLNLSSGSTVCFRVRAYFTSSELSDWSQPACGTV